MIKPVQKKAKEQPAAVEYQTKTENYTKSVTILIPLGLPGMGKTTLLESVFEKHYKNQDDVSFVSVSSDGIRKKLLDQYRQRNPNKSIDDAFSATRNVLSKEVSEFTENQILATKNAQGRTIQKQIIFLDKNHPPPVLEKLSDFLDDLQNRNPQIQIIKKGVIPSTSGHKNSGTKYPFSIQLLTTCYLRVLNRESHLTLSNENPELVARVLFGFFNSYKGMSFDNSFKKRFGLDHYLELDFAQENPDVQLPKNLFDSINQCLLRSLAY